MNVIAEYLIVKRQALISSYTFEIRAKNTDRQQKGQYVGTHTISLKKGVDLDRTLCEAEKRIRIVFYGSNRVYNLICEFHDYGDGETIERGVLF